jgi:hypothetical protein
VDAIGLVEDVFDTRRQVEGTGDRPRRLQVEDGAPGCPVRVDAMVGLVSGGQPILAAREKDGGPELTALRAGPPHADLPLKGWYPA